jgi:hypothetical protein
VTLSLTHLRHALALLGFALALLSIAFDNRMFGWLAILALGLSLIVRLITRKRVESAGEWTRVMPITGRSNRRSYFAASDGHHHCDRRTR